MSIVSEYVTMIHYPFLSFFSVDMSPLVLNEFLEVSLQLLNLSIIKSSLEPLPIKVNK